MTESMAQKNRKSYKMKIKNSRVLITGGSSGIGKETAKLFISNGAKVVITGRDENKLNSVAAEIGAIPLQFDIGDLASIPKKSKEAMALLEGKIDVLINNAGALFNPRKQTTEGLEQSFALLLVGPYILTERLHPILAKSESARVVNVLSGGMYSQKIQVNDLQSQRGEYSGSTAYARAKRGLMILTEEWAKRWKDDDISVNAMHPGWVATPGVVNALPEFYRVTKRLLRNLSKVRILLLG